MDSLSTCGCMTHPEGYIPLFLTRTSVAAKISIAGKSTPALARSVNNPYTLEPKDLTFTARTLRRGFVYIYDEQEKEKEKQWINYAVDPKYGFYRIKNHRDFNILTIAGKKSGCDSQNNGEISNKFISIPDNHGVFYLIWSPIKWSDEVREKFNDSAYRNQHMHKLDTRAYISSKQPPKNCGDINKLTETVLEYCGIDFKDYYKYDFTIPNLDQEYMNDNIFIKRDKEFAENLKKAALKVHKDQLGLIVNLDDPLGLAADIAILHSRVIAKKTVENKQENLNRKIFVSQTISAIINDFGEAAKDQLYYKQATQQTIQTATTVNNMPEHRNPHSFDRKKYIEDWNKTQKQTRQKIPMPSDKEYQQVAKKATQQYIDCFDLEAKNEFDNQFKQELARLEKVYTKPLLALHAEILASQVANEQLSIHFLTPDNIIPEKILEVALRVRAYLFFMAIYNTQSSLNVEQNFKLLIEKNNLLTKAYSLDLSNIVEILQSTNAVFQEFLGSDIPKAIMNHYTNVIMSKISEAQTQGSGGLEKLLKKINTEHTRKNKTTPIQDSAGKGNLKALLDIYEYELQVIEFDQITKKDLQKTVMQLLKRSGLSKNDKQYKAILKDLDTIFQEADAPEVDAPKTDAHKADAPETKAPETKASELSNRDQKKLRNIERKGQPPINVKKSITLIMPKSYEVDGFKIHNLKGFDEFYTNQHLNKPLTMGNSIFAGFDMALNVVNIYCLCKDISDEENTALQLVNVSKLMTTVVAASFSTVEFGVTAYNAITGTKYSLTIVTRVIARLGVALGGLDILQGLIEIYIDYHSKVGYRDVATGIIGAGSSVLILKYGALSGGWVGFAIAAVALILISLIHYFSEEENPQIVKIKDWLSRCLWGNDSSNRFYNMKEEQQALDKLIQALQA